MQAAFDGSQEVAFTIVSMTLSLAAVFIPVLFMGGVVGRLLHEFAVTIGVAILVSGFVSISLTPMLCSRSSSRRTTQKHGRFYNATERMFDAWLRLYDGTLRGDAAVPRGDDGRVGRAAGRHRVSLHDRAEGVPAERGPGPLQRQHRRRIRASASRRWSGTSKQVGDILDAGSEHRRVHQPGRADRRGGAHEHQGSMNVELKPRSERDAVGRSGHRRAASEAGAGPGHPRVHGQPAADQHRRRGRRRALYQFTLQDTDTEELYRWAPDSRREDAGDCRGSQDVNSDLLVNNPQLSIDLNRDRISALGLTVNQVETALYNAYGTRQVSQIYAPDNQYQVIMQVAPEFQRDPSALSLLYVRSSTRHVSIPLDIGRDGRPCRPAR